MFLYLKKFGVHFRAKDILSLIQIGYKYWERTSEQRHRPWLPLPNKHKHIINRPLIVQRNSNRYKHKHIINRPLIVQRNSNRYKHKHIINRPLKVQKNSNRSTAIQAIITGIDAMNDINFCEGQ